MAYVAIRPIATELTQSILAWCGVTDPTPAEVTIAGLAADAAESTIRHFRGLDKAVAWVAETDYVVGDVVQPTHPLAPQLYRCTTAGTSDDTEPEWDAEDDTTDGTVVWAAYTRAFETKYTSLALEMGVYLYQKRGVDGTTAFGEGGVQRSFETGSFPPSMLSRISLPIVAG